MRRKSTIFFIIIALSLAFVLLILPEDLFLGEKIPYSQFVSMVEEGKVESVTIYEERVKVRSEGKTYSTSNPDYPTFKEEMLLSGINVEMGTSSLSSALDTVFNILFLAIVAFAIYKALDWYFHTFRCVRHTGVHFSDIAGMEEVKRDMALIVDSMKHKDRTAIRNVKGIILEGPPGNGKTLFAKALAEEAGLNFIATRGADFQGALMGMGAMKVKMLFKKARRKKPSIVFIDEFDSIGEKRNYAGSGIDKENNRIITTLLNEMDGFSDKEEVLVVAATNSFQSLDAALIRPGRFDLKYTVSNPDHNTRMELIAIYTKGRKLSDTLNPQLLSSLFEGLSAAAIETVLNESEAIRVQEGKDSIDGECIAKAALKCREKLNVRRK